MQASITNVSGVAIDAKVVFLYLRGGSAIYLVGGKGSGADSLLSAIGAVDLGATQLPNPFNPMSSELMVKLNPDVILVMSKGLQSVGGISGLTELPGIAQTSAGKSQRIIAVDDSLLLSFGPRTPDLLNRLRQGISEMVKQ
jgi:iron complex transport system substrate-binding protein